MPHLPDITHAQVDVRSIAVFRILISAAILWDILYEFLPDAWWWFSDEGIVHFCAPTSITPSITVSVYKHISTSHCYTQGSDPRKFYIETKEYSWSWTLYLLSGQPIYPYILLTLHTIAAIIFAVGIFPRLSTFVLWVLHMSVRERNLHLMHGGASWKFLYVAHARARHITICCLHLHSQA